MNLRVAGEREGKKNITQYGVSEFGEIISTADQRYIPADGAVFYDLRYRRDMFTHKSHRIAIELSQSARSDLHDPSHGWIFEKALRARLFARRGAYAYPGERKKYLSATGGKTGGPSRRVGFRRLLLGLGQRKTTPV